MCNKLLHTSIKCKKTFNVYEAHKSPVRSLKLFSGDKLVSCSDDQSVKVWDIKNGFWLYTLKGHLDTINCIELLPNDLWISCSNEKTIKIWDLKGGQCLNTLSGHTGEVNFVLNIEKRSFKFLNNILIRFYIEVFWILTINLLFYSKNFRWNNNTIFYEILRNFTL